MLFLNLLSNPVMLLGFILALFISISIHEAAHAWMAYKLGDDTAKDEGRLTLNPFAHLDLFGTIFLLIVGFGWGKPVPINPSNLKNPKLDELKIALAGPASNFLMMVFLLLILRFIPMPEIISTVIQLITQINIILMVFNLIPIPPLDGSKLLKLLMSEEAYESIQQLGMPLLLVFLVFSEATNFLSTLIDSTVNFFFNLFLR